MDLLRHFGISFSPVDEGDKSRTNFQPLRLATSSKSSKAREASKEQTTHMAMFLLQSIDLSASAKDVRTRLRESGSQIVVVNDTVSLAFRLPSPLWNSADQEVEFIRRLTGNVDLLFVHKSYGTREAMKLGGILGVELKVSEWKEWQPVSELFLMDIFSDLEDPRPVILKTDLIYRFWFYFFVLVNQVGSTCRTLLLSSYPPYRQISKECEIS